MFINLRGDTGTNRDAHTYHLINAGDGHGQGFIQRKAFWDSPPTASSSQEFPKVNAEC